MGGKRKMGKREGGKERESENVDIGGDMFLNRLSDSIRGKIDWFNQAHSDNDGVPVCCPI